jgi:hypothetical protein
MASLSIEPFDHDFFECRFPEHHFFESLSIPSLSIEPFDYDFFESRSIPSLNHVPCLLWITFHPFFDSRSIPSLIHFQYLEFKPTLIFTIQPVPSTSYLFSTIQPPQPFFSFTTPAHPHPSTPLLTLAYYGRQYQLS